MLCWEPSRKSFCEFAKVFPLFAKVSRKLEIMNHFYCIHIYSLLSATTSCRPFISSQASEGEASPQPNTMVLKHILGPAAGTAQCCFLKSQEASSKRSNQASKSESLREPNTRGIFVKVAGKFCEPAGKSQSAF